MAEVTCKALRPGVPAFLAWRMELVGASASMYHVRMDSFRSFT